MLTVRRLREVLYYEPESGEFIWLVKKGCCAANTKAGRPHNQGYIRINIDKQSYLAHRLAWLYVHGKLPSGDIDHINLRKNDNRISNLREATRSQNKANVGLRKDNSTGFKGVSFDKQRMKFSASITIRGQYRHIGFFKTAALAHHAYATKAREIFGDFARP